MTYSKNDIGLDHGSLFQSGDRRSRRSEKIDYAYYEQAGEDPTNMETAFVRPLGQIIPRLELMGFTLDRARQDYVASVQRALDDRDDEEPAPDLVDFEAFCAFATCHPLHTLDRTFVWSSEPDAKRLLRGRFNDSSVVERLPRGDRDADNAYSEASFFGELIGILHPYSVLRVLGLSAENRSSEVIWQYGPLVDAGWAEADDFVAGARRTQTFLVATEGSSDTSVLRHAIRLLRPEVTDFFSFVDVQNWHPFSGAGNLVKFAEGLAKIDVQNQIVFLFDNDAEGVDAYRKVVGQTLPLNMGAMVLPELERFSNFPARGPDGVRGANINGRAAAIECYLDLAFGAPASPRVTWTNFKKDLDAYQGALDQKEAYTKTFLRQTTESLDADGYDVSGIRAILEALVAECTAIARSGQSRRLGKDQ